MNYIDKIFGRKKYIILNINININDHDHIGEHGINSLLINLTINAVKMTKINIKEMMNKVTPKGY
jgi:hypothetical protein